MKKVRIAAVLFTASILLTACASKPQQEEEKVTLVQEKAFVFSDGNYVDLWQEEFHWRDLYRLPDGTELLAEQTPNGPERVYVGGTESFDDLSEAAQTAVLAYYQRQGLLYDLEYELERAYDAYRECQSQGTEYIPRSLSQDISPTASNSRVMCFLTSAYLPIEGQTYEELRLGAVFDRETGEEVGGWGLFTVPEAEARQRLLDAADVKDTVLRGEMAAAMEPQYFLLFPGHLEISFRQGALPSQEYAHLLDVEYKGELLEFLQPWAIPDPSQ